MPVGTEEKNIIVVPRKTDPPNAVSSCYAELDDRLRGRPDAIFLDCSRLDPITSYHINILWDIHLRCRQAGIPLRLLSVRPGLERILKMLDLYHHFEISAEKPILLKSKIRPEAEDIERALDRFRDFLKQLDLDEICAFDLETAFHEVTHNIFLHGGLNRGDLIEFTATSNQGQISLRFVDPGSPFDPTSPASSFDPRVAIRTRQKRGFGLAMIKRLVDVLSYERVDNRLNVVTLKKNLCPKGVISHAYAKKAE